MSVEEVAVPTTGPETTATADWDTFMSGLNDEIKGGADNINSLIDQIENWIENSDADLIGGIIGFVVAGPIGAVVGALTGDEIKDKAWEKLREWADQVIENWNTLIDKVSEALGDIFGDPAGLIDIADEYTETAGLLSGMGAGLQRAEVEVDGYWSGAAAGDYIAILTAQEKALAQTAGLLRQLSTVVSDAAVTLMGLWLWFPIQIKEAALEITDSAAELGDAGEWLSAGAGVWIDIFTDVIQFITDVLVKVGETILEFAGPARTVANLNNTNEGFPDGAWPTSLSQIGSPGAWTPGL